MSPLIKWEHEIRILGADPLLNREMLNVMGRDGWELTCVVITTFNHSQTQIAYLKRPYVEQPPTLRVVPKDGA